MRTPSSARPASPQGLVEGRGKLFTFFAPLDLLAASFSTLRGAFLAAAFVLAFVFLGFSLAMFPPLPANSFDCVIAGLFLSQRALRVKIANAAAFAASRRIDHGIDWRRLAGAHPHIDSTLEFVGRRRIDADPAEGFYHLVVA